MLYTTHLLSIETQRLGKKLGSPHIPLTVADSTCMFHVSFFGPY
jgi:hypothetical protein